MDIFRKNFTLRVVILPVLICGVSFLIGAKSKNYPDFINWGGSRFLNTGKYYSEKDVKFVKIGKVEQYDIYKEIFEKFKEKNQPLSFDELNDFLLGSIFIKTEEGYLHYINENTILAEKPNIYLYPEKEIDVRISLKFDGRIITSYPKYNNGWRVVVQPNGTIIDSDGKEYSYLFWEGRINSDWNQEDGFIVEGKDTAEFLQDKLSCMGLTPREYNEFIVYWLPRMEKNKYNFISFVNEDYANLVRLDVVPEPDSVLRVFMVYKKLNKKVKIKEQKLSPFTRTGFAVVEWGGSCLDK